MSDALIWKLSPWDGVVHGFRELGETTSEAICEHSAPTVKLAEPEEQHKRCMRCLLFHGDALADAIDHRVRNAPGLAAGFPGLNGAWPAIHARELTHPVQRGDHATALLGPATKKG